MEGSTICAIVDGSCAKREVNRIHNSDVTMAILLFWCCGHRARRPSQQSLRILASRCAAEFPFKVTYDVLRTDGLTWYVIDLDDFSHSRWH